MATNTSNLEILVKLRDQTKAGLGSLQTSLSGLGSTITRVGGMMATFAGTMAAAGAVLGVKTAAEIETARAGLITLLGTAEKADATISRLKIEAARTPFEFTGLAQATQLMSSVTKDGDKSIDIILNVGEALAAMGKGQVELDRIIVNLQQIAAVGKASAIDIKQFAFAGIPIYEMLEEQLAQTTTELVTVSNAAGLTEKEIAKLGTKNSALSEKIETANLALQKQTNRLKELRQNDKEGGATYQNLLLDIDATKAKLAEYRNELDANNKTLGLAEQVTLSYGQSVLTLEEAADKGLISFEMFTEMFDKANDEGGRFFNAFINQAGTFNQAWSNMKDVVSITMADIVTETGAFDQVKKTLVGVTAALAENKDQIVQLVQTIQGGFTMALERVRSFFESTRPMWEFMRYQLTTLWTLIKEQLLPALVEFWDPVGKALAAFIGGVLYVAVVALIEVLRVLVVIVTGVLRAIDAVGRFIRDVAVLQIEVYKKAWEAILNPIEAVQKALKSVYEWAVKAFDKAKSVVGMGGSKSTKVDDAVISPSGNIVTTNPKDWLIATQNPYALAGTGGGITINIGNVNGSDREAAAHFASLIANEIKYRVRL